MFRSRSFDKLRSGPLALWPAGLGRPALYQLKTIPRFIGRRLASEDPRNILTASLSTVTEDDCCCWYHSHGIPIIDFLLQSTMASVLRPAIFRQACTTQRLFASPITNARPILAAFTKPAFQQTPARIAAFHVTSRRDILPPLPQRIEGTGMDIC